MAVILAIGMIGSAFAYFQDSDTSETNSFTAGTLGLQIWDDGDWDSDGWADTVDRTWEMSNMVPGTSQVTNFVLLRETGSIPGNHIEIAFTDSIVPAPLLPQDMAEWLEIDQLQYAYVNLKGALTGTPGWDVNGNGFLDLDDIVRSAALNAPGGPLDNLPPPNLFGGLVLGMANMHMTVKFNAGATNDIQGAALTLVVTFTLNQNSSQ
jgi:predicted ribosomally synthesized peptide with SipW-like signal peptide